MVLPKRRPARLLTQFVERDGRSELGTDLLAGDPFDDGVGPAAPRQHQPDARSDVEMPVGLRHEPALGNVEDPRFDAFRTQLANPRVELHAVTRVAPPFFLIDRLTDSRANHGKT